LPILLTLGFGLGCAFFVSIGLAQPVAQLSKELADAQERHQAVPEFSRTGIRELDRLADAIVTLSTDNYKAAVAERSRIEHERDYDALTGLYSRQAFFRVCGELFEKPSGYPSARPPSSHSRRTAAGTHRRRAVPPRQSSGLLPGLRRAVREAQNDALCGPDDDGPR